VELDDGFTSRCLEALKDYPITKDWTLIAQQLTYSDDWGVIWRAEFQRSRPPGDLSSNPVAVCWKSANGDLNIMFGVSEDTSNAA
jgi:hypothetical protein